MAEPDFAAEEIETSELQFGSSSKSDGGQSEWKLGECCRVNNAVHWSEDNLLSVIAGRCVEIVDPSCGTRCTVRLSSSPSQAHTPAMFQSMAILKPSTLKMCRLSRRW